jgi:hypothetical protein
MHGAQLLVLDHLRAERVALARIGLKGEQRIAGNHADETTAGRPIGQMKSRNATD